MPVAATIGVRNHSATKRMPITITFDLEDNRRTHDQPERFVVMSERFLEFLDRHHAKATVFVVGELGRTHPRLIRRFAQEGHEIGLHGLRHVPLEQVGRERLRDELREGRALLEQAAQVPVRGFRAPIFSLTPRTAWAREEIKAAGFSYSSSVLPAANPLHGWPGVPRTPFKWPNGLIELPCPVAGVGRAMLPYLGGLYLRYVPRWVTSRLLARTDTDAIAWTYVHPYDMDVEEPFFTLPHAGWLTSRLLHTRRGVTLRRLEHLLTVAGGAAPPLGERVAALIAQDLPVVV